jgi:hypothetical protein
MNATNNGYLGFDNVRVPREQMLMKNAQVLEVRNAVITWGWYRIMLVMQLLNMDICAHTHVQTSFNPPKRTHKWSVTTCYVPVPCTSLAWPVTTMFLRPHLLFVFVCKLKSMIYL